MMKTAKKFMALLLTVVMVLGMWPTAAFALEPGDHEDQVRVIVENATFTAAVDGVMPDWTGTLVDAWVDIDSGSTMMTAVVAALGTVGATQTGAESGYISSINGLEAFEGGAMSGWMGTLNDWFTNEGFSAYTVAAGTLSQGDEIRILYTQDYGEDLGGSWNNNDKTVKAVSFSVGELSSAFNKNTHTYTLTVPEGTTGVTVTPTASNKNFQVRTSVGGTQYKRTATVPVENGTVITVKCGDPAWPSMNGGSYGTADSVPAETYTFTVAMGGGSGSENTAPALADGVPAAATAEVALGGAYTLDLSAIFTDADGDALTYKVSVNGAAAVAADANYSYTPEAAGTDTLVFTASDGTADSADTYTVTLTANEAPAAWDGTVDTSWYNITDTSFTIGSGAQLAGLAAITNGAVSGVPADSFAGKKITLSADIDLNNLPWTSIGKWSTYQFAGTFDGNGKKIYNLSITATASYDGLFSGNTGTIKNLTIESGSVTSGYTYCASLVGYNSGKVINCLNRASVTSSKAGPGGLVGSNYGNTAFIVNSANYGSVTSTVASGSANTGGIAGSCTGYIINCYNTGSVQSANSANRLGGIAGSGATAKIMNCYNSGNVVSAGTGVGALVGYTLEANLAGGTAVLSNCYFLKTDTVNSALGALGDGIAVTDEQARAVDSAALAGLADELGSAFAKDTGGVNGGYPVLAWQNTGVYTDPTQESLDGLTVVSVSAVVNGAVTVKLDRAFIFTKLSAGDFTATLSVDGAEPQLLTLSGITQTGDTVVLSFAALAQETIDRTITVAVGYGEGEKQSGSFTLYADPDWLLYTQKPAVGDGTAESPYRIGTAAELAWFSALVNGELTDGTPQNTAAYAVLTADIALNDTANWQAWDKDTLGIRCWTPIGYSIYDKYTGVFDGQGYTVSGMYISDKSAKYGCLGLFGILKGETSRVKNVNVVDSYIYHINSNKVNVEIGTIAGEAESGSMVMDCSARARLEIRGYYPDAGGILGVGSVSGCCFYGSVTVINTTYQSTCAGGIVGDSASVSDCYNFGTVSVSGTYTGGTEKKPDYAGGIAGMALLMENCYSAGGASCSSGEAHALIGGIYTKSVYSEMGEYLGIEVLTNVVNSYYLDTAGTDSYGAAKTAAEFADGTVAALLGEAFTTDPDRNGGYPCLVWQTRGPVQEETEVAAPVITAEGGRLGGTVTFKITCATEGAAIHYTTDGSAPTASSAAYTDEGVTLSEGTVRAIAVKEGLTDSAISSETVAPVTTPVITPETRVISGETIVTITAATPDAAIYYTTDGASPLNEAGDALSANAVEYTGSFTVSADTVVTAVALKTGLLKSAFSSEEYTCSWTLYAQRPAQDANGVYLIGTAEELSWFAGLVNGTLAGVAQNRNANAKLTADISLAGHVWIPIGAKTYQQYGGLFDGAGHTVGNMELDTIIYDQNASTENGLFGYNGGTIQNVGMTGEIIVRGAVVGAVCASNSGTVTNCWNAAKITSDHGFVGGICGSNQSTGLIRYCHNTGTILGGKYPDWTSGIMASYVGGICGENCGSVMDCYNTGTLTCMYGTGYYWGNIAGNLKSTGTITRCYSLSMMTEGCHRDANYGDIGGWQAGAYSATLAGGSDTATVTDSYYLKDVIIKGSGLDSVAFSDQYRAYLSKSTANTYGFAGFVVSKNDYSKLDADKMYYAFYDATNDRIIALKLDGEGDGGDVVIDAKNPGGVSFSGTVGQYLSRTTKTIYVATVPAATTRVKFINTDELQDFTFYLKDDRAIEIMGDNKAAALAQVESTWPAAYDAVAAALVCVGEAKEPVEGEVHVIVENTTFTEAVDGVEPDWTDTLVDVWVDIDEDSTMMSAIADAIGEGGYTQEGAESGYISSINGLAAFEGGSGSGWMGTLNDWFVNAGFNEFKVEDGSLEPGDEICVLYTQDYGEDLGGSWNNNDKTVKAIAFSVGALSSAFDGGTHAYTLTVPEGTTGVVIAPTASNKNFQVRTSVGDTEYKRTATVPVENGTVITVKCGDPAWPSMNGGDYGTADSVPAETYTITVAYGEPNTAPALAQGIPAAVAAGVALGGAYTLDLSAIFTDADGDALTYKVSVNGAAAVAADANYSYTPEAAGTDTLVFTASDGTADSADTYTVTLTANQPTTFKVDGKAVTFENMGWYYKATVTVHGSFTVSVTAEPDVNIAGSLTGMGSASGEFTPTSARTTVRVILQQGTGAGVIYYIYAEQAAGETPVFTSDLSSDTIEYTLGDTASPLSVTVAEPSGGGVLSYQWYGSADNGTFTAIDGATQASYTPDTATAGTTYYKVVVTNTCNFTTSSSESHVAAVKVNQPEIARLASLVIHTGTSPSASNVLLRNEGDPYDTALVFGADTLGYTLAAQTDSVTQLRFRALAADDGATVTIYYGDGQSKDITWTSGSSKWANCLTAGRNVFTLVVTPPEGSAKQPATYTFTIDCAPTLSAMSIGGGGVQFYLDKAFAAATTDYTLTIPENTVTVDVAATPTSDAYTLAYNGSASSTVDISSADRIDIAVTGGAGENALTHTYTVTLAKAAQLDFKVNATPADAIVKVYDQNGANAAANADGSFSGMFGTFNYTYTVTKYGYVAQSGTVPATGGALTVTLAQAADGGHEDVGAFWPSFRGSDDNMAITGVALPTEPENINLKWNAQLGTGWSAAPSVQIIVDGALVVMCGTTIYKLDLQTGETLATGTMAAAPNFGYTPPVYAEGMIFCPLTGGVIQAFDAKTLESLWVYTDNLGGQSLSPITYDDGYIYTGFWNGESKNANYVCLSVTDEDVARSDESKTATWKHTQQGGFYWAGSVVVGDAVIVGTDDGASGYTGASKLYSFNQFTGEILSALDITGDQRSSIAYDEGSGRIYFTTKCGYLYSARVNAATGKLSDLKGVNYNAQSTSTPVVYKGKVYIGVGSGISSTGSSGNLLVADADSLEMLYAVGLKGYPQCSMLLTTAYEEETGYIYLYSTYNATPGGISMIKVDPDATTAAGAELIELYDAAGFSQYCITSLICGPDGTIYYKNDSGNVLAVGVPRAVGVMKLIDAIGEVTLHSADAIAIARNAYNALADSEKADVANYNTLIAAEARYAELCAAADRAAAMAVETKISAIGAVTLESESAITTARTAYDALTGARKKLVSNYGTLTAAEARYAQLVTDATAAKAVDQLIGSIGAVTLESYGAITAARTAYDALTGAQKALVTNLAALTAAEARYAELAAAASQAEIDEAAAAGVDARISAIGTVTLESHGVITVARSAYDALTGAQKALVTNLAALTAAEARYAELKAEADQAAIDAAEASKVKAKITAIGAVTLSDRARIAAARTAYNALTATQKSMVTNYTALVEAEARYAVLKNAADQAEVDEAAAAGVEEMIADIGTVTLSSEDKIITARAAYGGLTNTQKNLVSNYGTLTQAEEALAALRETAQEAVTVEEEETPLQSVTIDGVTYEADDATAEVMLLIQRVADNPDDNGEPDMDTLIAAYRAYEALTDEQKTCVANMGKLEEYMALAAKANHTDETTGVSVEGLEWYIRVEATVEPLGGEAAAALQGVIGDNTLLLMVDIKLYDLISGAAYEPEAPVTVRIPAPDMTGYDGVVIVHRKADGTIEYLEATLEGGELVFTATSFSAYAVAGYAGQSPLDLREEASRAWIAWVCAGAVLLAALGGLMILSRKRRAAGA